MGSNGEQIDAGDQYTPARMNQKLVRIDTAANINAGTKTDGMMVYPTTSAGDLTSDVPATYDNGAGAFEDFVMKTRTQTLTNKTLTSPTINTPTITTPRISNPYLEMRSRLFVSLPPHYQSNGPFWTARVELGTAAIAQGTAAVGLSTGATASSDCGIQREMPQNITGNKAFELGLAFRTDSSDVTDTEFEIGVSSETASGLSTSADHHITLRYNTAVSNKWILANANGTTETTTVTALADVAAATNYYVVIINKESSVEFFVNGVSAGAAHTTNLPTSTTMNVVAFLNNIAAEDKDWSIKDGYFMGDWA